MKPLCIDLFCGLGGFTEGFLAEGYDVIGFDIERHVYGEHRYPAQLVLQDVRTLHGAQFKDAAVIVASPPCQEYSYMAMPWSRAKAIAAEYRSGVRDVRKLTELFDACFRIAREAGVPLIVENVKGAQPWVGPAKWHYGSFYLWGDVPALMPTTRAPLKGGDRNKNRANGHEWTSSFADTIGITNPGMDWSKYGQPGHKAEAFNATSGQRFREQSAMDGMKSVQDGLGGYGGSFGWNNTPMRRGSSKSDSRKAASAQIARIPLPLSKWIANVSSLRHSMSLSV